LHLLGRPRTHYPKATLGSRSFRGLLSDGSLMVHRLEVWAEATKSTSITQYSSRCSNRISLRHMWVVKVASTAWFCKERFTKAHGIRDRPLDSSRGLLLGICEPAGSGRSHGGCLACPCQDPPIPRFPHRRLLKKASRRLLFWRASLSIELPLTAHDLT
jgi:hypothetical protein